MQTLPVGMGDEIAWAMSCACAGALFVCVNLENMVRLLLLYVICASTVYLCVILYS